LRRELRRIAAGLPPDCAAAHHCIMWHHSVVREPVCSSIPFVTNELKRTTVSKRSIASPSERSRSDGPLPTRSTAPRSSSAPPQHASKRSAPPRADGGRAAAAAGASRSPAAGVASTRGTAPAGAALEHAIRCGGGARRRQSRTNCAPRSASTPSQSAPASGTRSSMYASSAAKMSHARYA